MDTNEVHELKGIYREGGITRREFLRMAALLGMSLSSASAFLAACAPAAEPTAAPTKAPAAIPTKAPTATPAGPKRGGTFVLGTPQLMTHFDPYIGGLKNLWNAWPGLWNRLVMLDHEAEAIPDLAESWETSDDLRTYTFKLRKGVKFHNGRELVAEDVKWVMDKQFEEGYASIFKAILAPILDSVEVPDKYTVKFNLKTPDAVLPHLLFRIPIACPEEFGHVNEHPIGTGPYKFVERIPNQRTVLERFDDHFKGKPYLDQVRIQIQPDTTAALATFTTGGWDFYWQLPAKYHDLVDDAEGMRLARPPVDTVFTLFQLPVNLFPFKDPKARLALYHAMDREAMVQAAYFGRAIPCKDNQPLPPGHWAHNPDLEEYPYDLEKAKQLFAEAGVHEGDTLIFKAPAVNPEWKPISEILERSLNEIGIGFDIELQELSAWLDLVIEPVGYTDMMFTTNIWSPQYDPSDLMKLLSSDASSAKLMGYSNAELDELIKKGRQVAGVEERSPIYHRAMEILHGDSAWLVIAFWGWTHAVWDYVKEVWIDHGGDPFYENAWLDK